MTERMTDEVVERYCSDNDWWRRKFALDLRDARAQYTVLREAVNRALNELGVPQPGYPYPVANAVEILREALTGGGGGRGAEASERCCCVPGFGRTPWCPQHGKQEPEE